MRLRTLGLVTLSLIGALALTMPALAQTEPGAAQPVVVSAPVPTSVTVGTSTCKLNGKEVPCEQLAKTAGAVVGWGLGFILFMLALGLAVSVFWLMMLIHAATHPIQNRPMWILLMVFTGILGAIIYYFVVKRKFAAAVPGSPAMAAAPGALPGEMPATQPPPAPQLVEYVRNARQAGTGDDAIRQALAASGWNPADIERALKP